MRKFLALAGALVLVAGVAHAQFQPIPPIPGAPPAPKPFKPYEGYQGPKPYQPYNPARAPSVYGDGPFSPAGEARRERRQEAAERARQNGPFSPEASAKRDRAQAKRDATINPY